MRREPPGFPVDDDIHRPRLGTHIEDFLPGVAPIGGTKDPALLVVAVRMSERRDINDVGIGGVHANARDRLCIRQAQVPPGLAAVGGLVDAVALGDAAAELGLAHANVNDVRVGFRYGHRAHRGAGHLPVGDREPGVAAVRGLPEPAAGGPEVVLVGPGGASRATDRSTPRLGPMLRQESVLKSSASKVISAAEADERACKVPLPAKPDVVSWAPSKEQSPRKIMVKMSSCLRNIRPPFNSQRIYLTERAV